MNSFKLAMRNIKKSMRDYVVYFITLIIGVALFYVFSSVGEQSVVKEIAGTQYEVVEILLLLLDAVSIGVAFVLGFLIIYANNFLIRRRKKEFGVYMLLGMGKRSVSQILVQETVLVGMLSLAVGLGIGILSSQFMSILVGKLFEADMSQYAFSVSGKAIGKTIINFTIMYVIVLLFHSVTISKYKLIDLLSADKKTEKQMLKNPIVAFLVFAMAAVFLGYAYYRVGFCTKDLDRDELVRHIVVGIVATLLLFWSMSGFLLSMLRKWKRLYHKNLNSFLIRQFCNSINSSAVTMGIICLMLFVTICTFSSGFSLVHQMQTSLHELTPADYSILYTGEGEVVKSLEKKGMEPAKLVSKNSVEVPIYENPSFTVEVSLGSGAQAAKEAYPYAIWEAPEDIMCLSDYNAVATLYGKETITLQENEYAMVCDYAFFSQLRNDAMEKGERVKISTLELVPAYTECVEGYILMSGGNTNAGVVVVPDEVITQSATETEVSSLLLVGNYNTNSANEKEKLDWELLKITQEEEGFSAVATKISIREANNGATMMVAFIVIYLGAVFLISSAALLSMKALSESIDTEGKYTILKKIGSDAKMLRKALFIQIGVYFALPLFIACFHSVFGLRFAQFALSTVIQKNICGGVIVTAAVLAVLYGGYFLATYKGSKRIVGMEE